MLDALHRFGKSSEYRFYSFFYCERIEADGMKRVKETLVFPDIRAHDAASVQVSRSKRSYPIVIVSYFA